MRRMLRDPRAGQGPARRDQQRRPAQGGRQEGSATSFLEDILAAELRKEGIKGWRREVRFHPSRSFAFDFAWPHLKLAVEVEGGTENPNNRGRHVRPDGYRRDCEKYNEAQLLGWTVLRFTRLMICGGKKPRTKHQYLMPLAIPTIKRALKEAERDCQKAADGGPEEEGESG